MSDKLDRDSLGRIVREAWVDYCRETGDAKPSHVAPYDELREWDKEADQRIGVAVAEHVRSDQDAQRAELRSLAVELTTTISRFGLMVASKYGDGNDGESTYWRIIADIRNYLAAHPAPPIETTGVDDA